MPEITKIENSSNIDELSYDRDNGDLIITFRGGRRYRYSGVPAETHQALIGAESVGAYFAREIKANFDCEKIEDPTPAAS